MHAVYDIAPDASARRALLVMLPGARDKPQDFVEQGFVRALRERELAVDVAAVDAHMDYYLDQNIVERLRQDVVAPARARGYEKIWLMGISLGGMGALLYLRAHAAEIAGAILLAPFLGLRGTVAAVAGAGGLHRWQPGEIQPDDDDRALLAWLRDYPFHDPASPKIYLGYGEDDRFAPGSKLLAARLPPQRVLALPGGHDWATWMALWLNLQDRKPFSNDDAL